MAIIQYIEVRGIAHPYDPFHAEYFEQRRHRQWWRRPKDCRFLAIPTIARMVDGYRHIYWRYCRVIKPAFEGLELLAGKLARAVLRGPGAGDSPRLLGSTLMI